MSRSARSSSPRWTARIALAAARIASRDRRPARSRGRRAVRRTAVRGRVRSADRATPSTRRRAQPSQRTQANGRRWLHPRRRPRRAPATRRRGADSSSADDRAGLVALQLELAQQRRRSPGHRARTAAPRPTANPRTRREHRTRRRSRRAPRTNQARRWTTTGVLGPVQRDRVGGGGIHGASTIRPASPGTSSCRPRWRCGCSRRTSMARSNPPTVACGEACAGAPEGARDQQHGPHQDQHHERFLHRRLHVLSATVAIRTRHPAVAVAGRHPTYAPRPPRRANPTGRAGPKQPRSTVTAARRRLSGRRSCAAAAGR